MRGRPRRLAAAGLMAAAMASCGKKGPPLPPFVHVPEAVRQIAARRMGDAVVLTVSVPTRNVDESTPVALGRIEVWGYTGRSAPPATRFLSVASLVATVQAPEAKGPSVTLRDPLTGDKLVEAAPPAPDRASSPPRPERPGPLKRFYLAIPFSERGRPGPPSMIAEVTLTALPDAPLDVEATYTEQSVTVRWSPSGGIVGFLLDRAVLPSASPVDDGPPVTETGLLPPGPTRYNVYGEVESASDTKPAGSPNRADTGVDVLLTRAPVETLVFTEPIQLDGRRHCYRVSAVRGTGDGSIEGKRSEPACIVAIDIFPPAAPTGVSPIAVAGEISVIWEANRESDLDGYIVLRGEAGSAAALMPVTEAPIKETRFTDRSVRPGVRYVYAVEAVDTWRPQPNVSPESERVEVTAR